MKASVSRGLSCLQTALAISLTIVARAQTNTFPSSGAVGIGTTSPSLAKLQIGTPSGSDTFGSGFDVAGKSQIEVSNNGITEVLRLSNYSGASAGIGPRLTFASNNNELTAAITGVFDGGTNGQLRFDTETAGVLTEKLRVTSAGNVGIGTTNPQSNLDLGDGTGGHSLVWGGGSGASHYASIGTAYSSAALSLVYGLKLNTANDQYLYSYSAIGRAGIRIGGVPSEISFFSAASSTQSVNGVFDYLSNTKLIIKESGNVGINSVTPLGKLTVHGATNKNLTVDTISTGEIGLQAANDANNAYATMGFNAANYTWNIGSNPKMYMDTGGNVGIGTTNPTQKLSVNGTIQAKEVIVQTGWSDYVFKPDYQLASLSEVEAHIKAHGHLPGVPSAAQVAKEGIPVGEMQSKLLAKIEELTLHQIEQEKEISALRAEVSKLQKNSSR